ncbi:MAG: hypothetical protein K9N48_06995 [Verrucomicrobia bacterium]|nr:hypothetical protein [Verrucomicrobiota bacterium]MCF7707563.1 hypothetical protein [Verrucomicrobiota bacterium]
MTINLSNLSRIGLITLFLFNFSAPAQETEEQTEVKPRYKTGYSAIRTIGRELYTHLDAEYQKLVNVEPLFLEIDMTPFIRLAEYPEEPKPLPVVFISVGFVDLVNNVAHAKAIDKINEGYFENYIISLSQEKGVMELKPLPGIDNKEYWSLNMLNEQLSNFNQIVGCLVGIKMAHHYLGHYDKYENQLNGDKDKPKSINEFITEDEFEDAVDKGVNNAFNCGYGVDGMIALLECIDEMPQRPDWTTFFLPRNADVDDLIDQLRDIEEEFFMF